MTKLALLFIASFTTLLIQGGRSKKLIVKNNCGEIVWPVVATYPSNSAPTLQTFKLDPAVSLVLDFQGNWSGSIWGRTYCSPDASGTLVCLTGKSTAIPTSSDIAPATILGFQLQGDGKQDSYIINLIEGFNLPVSIKPQGITGCTTVSCMQNINAQCPPLFQVKGPDGSTVVGCKSACTYFNTDQDCCTGDYNSPSTCKPSNYTQVFKTLCPQGCSYRNDGNTCYFECVGTEYDITFCP